MQRKILPLFAATIATTIYGLNHTIAKMVMPIYIGSLGLVLLRVLGATIIFWIISLFFKSKPIEKKDRFTIIKCGLFGMSINIAAFIAGLDYSTPVNSSILIIISPIFVVILSFFIFKNKVNFIKIIGIFLGFVGALILILTGIGSWRIIVGGILGASFMGFLFNLWAANELMSFSWINHLIVGGFAFGIVFMATDPVSAAQTQKGKWIYGILVGILCILIRVFNPAYPEGVMLAILLMNVFAPTIDHYVIEESVKRREKRSLKLKTS